jgi:hypothetical protein
MPNFIVSKLSFRPVWAHYLIAGDDVMKEYSHGVPIEIKRRQRRNRAIERHAYAIVFVAIVVSMAVIGAVTVSISSPPGQQEEQKAHISWTTEVVDSNGDVGQYCSLVLTGSDNPEIAYYNATGGDLKIAGWTGSSWNVNPLPSANDVGSYVSQTRNSATTIKFVCTYDATNHDIIYMNSLGHYGVVDSSGDVGQYASIAVSSVTGALAISYYNASSGDLKVAVNASGSGWINKTVDSVGDVGLYTNIVFQGANDTISVLYYDATNHALKTAYQWGGTVPWLTMTMDEDPPLGDLGKWSSQTTNGWDWYASYYDQTNGALRVMYWTDLGASSGLVVPDSVGDVGQYTSIGVNSTGRVFVSYYDVTNGNLKLAWNESTSWYNMTLDSTDNVGLYTSLKIDSSDAIHISYYDATNGDLKYVKVLQTEFPIPEFGDVVIPIVGAIAIMAVLSVRRNQKEQ